MPADQLTAAIELLQREIEFLKDGQKSNDEALERAHKTIGSLEQNRVLIADALTSFELALAKLTT